MRGPGTSFPIRTFLRYLFSVLLLLTVSACVTVWDGFTNWTFRVGVYDQATTALVPNADVSIIVKNEDSFGDIESFVQEKEPKKCTTNSEGVCELRMKFNTYGHRSFWKSDAFVNFRHRNLVVEAKGYRPLNLPLKTFIKTPYELPFKANGAKSSEIRVKVSRVE